MIGGEIDHRLHSLNAAPMYRAARLLAKPAVVGVLTSAQASYLPCVELRKTIPYWGAGSSSAELLR